MINHEKGAYLDYKFIYASTLLLYILSIYLFIAEVT